MESQHSTGLSRRARTTGGRTRIASAAGGAAKPPCNAAQAASGAHVTAAFCYIGPQAHMNRRKPVMV